MSESTTQERVDHVEMARRLLGEANDAPAETVEQAGRDAITEAQVHSNLAIASELQGIREALEAGNLTYADGMVRDVS